MSVIDKGQGAVKLSEVFTDSAEALLQTAIGEDGQTVVDQIRKILTDNARRAGLLLTSRNAVDVTAGAITWTGTQINFLLNTDILVKLLQNESGSVIDLKLAYGATNTATTFNTVALTNGQIMYAELSRNGSLQSSPIVLQNAAGGGSLISGATIKVATSMPALLATQSDGAVSGTICIPLAMRIDSSLWWIPHGIYWPPNTSSPLGAVVVSTSIPIGTQIPWHTFSAASPKGYSQTKLAAPGFQLCDGSVVIDPLSPLFNPTRNIDGTPSVSYNPALDNFTPNINGEHTTWTSAQSWFEGDYVIDSGTRYVAIQNVPISTAISNTSFWIPEATYNNTSSGNPYNKYRKTTQNQGINSRPRGNNTSFAASSASSYGGENTHQLAVAELPAHNHTMETAGDHDHGGATESAGAHTHTGNTGSSGSHNHGGATGSAGSHNHGGGTGAALNVTVATAGGGFGFEGGDDGFAVSVGGTVNLNHSHSIGTDGAHTHSISTDGAHTHTISSDGAHTHVIDSDGDHTHVIDVSGGSGSSLGNAHNVENRYINSLYIVRIF